MYVTVSQPTGCPYQNPRRKFNMAFDFRGLNHDYSKNTYGKAHPTKIVMSPNLFNAYKDYVYPLEVKFKDADVVMGDVKKWEMICSEED